METKFKQGPELYHERKMLELHLRALKASLLKKKKIPRFLIEKLWKTQFYYEKIDIFPNMMDI